MLPQIVIFCHLAPYAGQDGDFKKVNSMIPVPPQTARYHKF